MQVFISRWPDLVSDPDSTISKSSRADRLRIHETFFLSRVVFWIQNLIWTDLDPRTTVLDFFDKPATCSGF